MSTPYCQRVLSRRCPTYGNGSGFTSQHPEVTSGLLPQLSALPLRHNWDHESTTIFLEVKGNKLYYTVGFPKGYNANTPSWIQFEIFERKFKDGIGLRTAHVSCAINGVEYKDWEVIDAIYR